MYVMLKVLRVLKMQHDYAHFIIRQTSKKNVTFRIRTTLVIHA